MRLEVECALQDDLERNIDQFSQDRSRSLARGSSFRREIPGVILDACMLMIFPIIIFDCVSSTTDQAFISTASSPRARALARGASFRLEIPNEQSLGSDSLFSPQARPRSLARGNSALDELRIIDSALMADLSRMENEIGPSKHDEATCLHGRARGLARTRSLRREMQPQKHVTFAP